MRQSGQATRLPQEGHSRHGRNVECATAVAKKSSISKESTPFLSEPDGFDQNRIAAARRNDGPHQDAVAHSGHEHDTRELKIFQKPLAESVTDRDVSILTLISRTRRG